MNNALGRACAVLVFLACTGCTHPAAQAPSAATADAPLAGTRALRCFRVGEIDSWRVIDDRQLVVYGPGRKQAWYLKLFMACDGLRTTDVLGLRSAGANLVCGEPGDDVVWRDRRCAISEVRALSPAEAKALLDGDVRDDIGKLPGRTPGSDGGKEQQ